MNINQDGLWDWADLCAEFRRMAKEAGSQAALASQLCHTPQFLNAVMSGHRRAPDAMLAAMGLRRVERFERMS